MDEQRLTGVGQARLDALQGFLARVGPEGAHTNARFDEAAAEVLDEFDRGGVDALLLKGQGLATLLYGSDGRRSFSDVDLLVAPAGFKAAEEALARLGYVDAGADHGIDDVGGVIHAQTWIRTVPASAAHPPIDLHRWLPGSGADPTLAWAALTARRTWIELDGRQAPVLDRVGQAMHLSTHAAQHGPAFEKHLSELELALALWPPEVWDAAARLASEVGATEAFAAGLRLSRLGAAVATQLELPATDRLDWVIRHRQERPRGTFHIQALAEAQSVHDRLDVLRRSLLPRRAWIVHQQPSANRGSFRLLAAYGRHLTKAPGWAARAWRFRRRARRAGQVP